MEGGAFRQGMGRDRAVRPIARESLGLDAPIRNSNTSRPTKPKRNDVALPSSDDAIVLLHNPRCSKSRATLALLEERGVDFETRLYLDEPLDESELRALGERLGRSVIDYTRTKQTEFAEAGLSKSSADDAILAAMAKTPILMERPIVVRGSRAAIGRPPEDVLGLLD